MNRQHGARAEPGATVIRKIDAVNEAAALAMAAASVAEATSAAATKEKKQMKIKKRRTRLTRLIDAGGSLRSHIVQQRDTVSHCFETLYQWQ